MKGRVNILVMKKRRTKKSIIKKKRSSGGMVDLCPLWYQILFLSGIVSTIILLFKHDIPKKNLEC